MPLQNSIHLQVGNDSRVAFVFSCPGRDEFMNNSPASGATGDNLEILLHQMRHTYRDGRFERKSLRITNSTIESLDSNDETTEAQITDVLNNQNLDRLSRELNDVTEIIICSGLNATAAINVLSTSSRLNHQCKIAYIPHLGNKSINRSIKYSINGYVLPVYHRLSDVPNSELRTLSDIRSENRNERLCVVAKMLFEQINVQRPLKCKPVICTLAANVKQAKSK